ncbi:MAG: hypothetical protein J7530_02220 [Novosphingobium sp.]|nr:hypothetical protein [Novosphingobium sp.]
MTEKETRPASDAASDVDLLGGQDHRLAQPVDVRARSFLDWLLFRRDTARRRNRSATGEFGGSLD